MADFVIRSWNGQVHVSKDNIGRSRTNQAERTGAEERRIVLKPGEETLTIASLQHVYADEITAVKAAMEKRR